MWLPNRNNCSQTVDYIASLFFFIIFFSETNSINRINSIRCKHKHTYTHPQKIPQFLHHKNLNIDCILHTLPKIFQSMRTTRKRNGKSWQNVAKGISFIAQFQLYYSCRITSHRKEQQNERRCKGHISMHGGMGSRVCVCVWGGYGVH